MPDTREPDTLSSTDPGGQTAVPATRIIFVLNPNANAGSHSEAEFDTLLTAYLEEYAQLGHRPPVYQKLMAQTTDELRRILREKLAAGEADLVGVVGGDGSVMEVLPVMLDFPEVRLSLIPFGTGNLLAANLGIPKDFNLALNIALHGSAHRIDLGRMNGKHCFALLAGVGTVAEIMNNTSSSHKKLLGMWAYLVDGVRSIMSSRRAKFRIRIDGQMLVTKGVSIVISNAASTMQPCPALTPNAIPDDGMLDVCIVKAKEQSEYMATVYEAFRGQHVAAPTPYLSYYRAKEIIIESWPRLKVQADGNIIGKTPVRVEVLPQAVPVMVPAIPVGEAYDESVSTKGFFDLVKSYFD